METELKQVKKEIVGIMNDMDNIRVLKYIKQILIGASKKD